MSWITLQNRITKLETPPGALTSRTLEQVVLESMGQDAGPPARVLRQGEVDLETLILAAPHATECRPATPEQE